MTNSVPSDTEQLRQRNRELSILNIIAEALNRETDLNQTLHTVLVRVTELFKLQTGWIWLIQKSSGTFYLAAALNLPPALTTLPHRMEGWCHCRESYEVGDLSGAANVNIIQCTRLNGLVDGTGGLRYHASVPLYAHGEKLGILNVASSDWGKLSPDDLRLLYTIGDLLSIAIERARLFAQSTQLGMLEERNRLAREIHDTVAQGLAATALQLETADVLLENDVSKTQIRDVIQRALNLTRANLEEVRRSVSDLRAAPLEGRSLGLALTELATALTSEMDLVPTVDLIGMERPLAPAIEIGLYRIAHEAINNVVQHTGASKLSIQLSATPTRIELVLEDNGKGFDAAQVPEGRFGLIGINERARLLGGTVEIFSTLGEGTTLRIIIPLVETR
jgi:two-component system NarL family sensor kinase